MGERKLLLVEVGAKRYIGWSSDPAAPTDAPPWIQLQDAYEIAQRDIMTDQGPSFVNLFRAIGDEGAQSWRVLNPSGFREIEAHDALRKRYEKARAGDSGLVLAHHMPKLAQGRPA